MDSPTVLPLIGGLLIALGGAGLLAAGSELQSRSVVDAGGRVSRYLRSRRWLAGAGLLGIGVASNLLALALAPVSVVQSMGIAALVCSVAYGAATGRIVVTARVVVSGVLAIGGVAGTVALITGHPNPEPSAVTELLPALTVVVLAAGAALLAALLVVRAWTADLPRGLDAVVLVLGAAGFGCTTTVLKVVVSSVQQRGAQAALTDPHVWGILAAWLCVGVLANLAVQRSYGRFPTATVVAGMTIVDPTIAAIVGVGVLGEAQWGLAGSLAFGGLIALAAIGVIGLTRIDRRGQRPPERRAGSIPARLLPTPARAAEAI